jgi:hypothetical protein
MIIPCYLMISLISLGALLFGVFVYAFMYSAIQKRKRIRASCSLERFDARTQVARWPADAADASEHALCFRSRV